MDYKFIKNEVQECLYVLQELYDLTPKRSYILFTKEYNSFLTDKKLIVQEASRRGIYPITLFKESLYYKVLLENQDLILSEEQEQFLYDMLNNNKYIKENQEFIRKYYNNGMKSLLNEGIDPVNYRAVMLLNEKFNFKGLGGKIKGLGTAIKTSYTTPGGRLNRAASWAKRGPVKWTGSLANWATGGLAGKAYSHVKSRGPLKSLGDLINWGSGGITAGWGKTAKEKWASHKKEKARKEFYKDFTPAQVKDIEAYFSNYNVKSPVTGEYGSIEVPAKGKQGQDLKTKKDQKKALNPAANMDDFESHLAKISRQDLVPLTNLKKSDVEAYQRLKLKYRSGAPLTTTEKKQLSFIDKTLHLMARQKNKGKNYAMADQELDIRRNAELDNLRRSLEAPRERRGGIASQNSIVGSFNRIASYQRPDVSVNNASTEVVTGQTVATPAGGGGTVTPSSGGGSTAQTPTGGGGTVTPSSGSGSTAQTPRPNPHAETDAQKEIRNFFSTSGRNLLQQAKSTATQSKTSFTPKTFADFLLNNPSPEADRFIQYVNTHDFGKGKNTSIAYGMFDGSVKKPLEVERNPTEFAYFDKNGNYAGEMKYQTEIDPATNKPRFVTDKKGRKIPEPPEPGLHRSTRQKEFLTILKKHLENSPKASGGEATAESYASFKNKFDLEIRLSEIAGISSRNFYQMYLIERVKEVYGLK